MPCETLDHILPRRFLLRFKKKPHELVNLVSLCQVCHGQKKKAEYRLFAVDMISYVEELQRIQYPMNRLAEAAKHYGFPEVLKLLRKAVQE
jgi:hypothetical protein